MAVFTASGAAFIRCRTALTLTLALARTDQLDGETDWKLRLAVPATQVPVLVSYVASGLLSCIVAW